LLSGNIGWDYKDVLPFFKKSENNMDRDTANDTTYHSAGGYLSVGRFPYQDKNVHTFIKGFEELGYSQVDFNSKHVTGVMVIQATQEKGERRSTNRAFLEPLRGIRRNLKVVTNIRVTKVLIDPANTRAYGVEYAYERNRTSTGKILAAKEVIVSGGTVNSPQLLMLSGIGPREVLQGLGIKVIKDLKVGQNLQDHVGAKGITFKLSNASSIVPTGNEVRRHINEYYQTSERNGPLSGTGVNQLEGYIKSRYISAQVDYPDIQYFAYSDIISDHPEKCTLSITRPLSYYNIIQYRAALVRPNSRGNITINSKDPFAPPLIYPNYFSEPRDLDVIIDAMNSAVNLSKTDALNQAGYYLDTNPLELCRDYKFGTNKYWTCLAKNYTQTLYHPAGTCKMGPSHDTGAVVDPQLRIYGVKGLRVADASVMPRVLSGNLNAGTIMIAEKCADFIKRDYGKSRKEKRQVDNNNKIKSTELTESMRNIKTHL
jgi:choline dehydrogenase-like flavoprotein